MGENKQAKHMRENERRERQKSETGSWGKYNRQRQLLRGKIENNLQGFSAKKVQQWLSFSRTINNFKDRFAHIIIT